MDRRARSSLRWNVYARETRRRESCPLTDEQKTAIAEARSFFDAKVAEGEILHRDALRKAKSHEEIAKLSEELAQDRDRLVRDRDRKIAEIRERPVCVSVIGPASLEAGSLHPSD